MRIAWRRWWRDWLSVLLAAAYILDRGLKVAAVVAFFRRPPPPSPARCPGVTLLQPITRGVSDLPAALAARAAQRYAGDVQHLLICDAGDDATQAVCRNWLARQPAGSGELVLAGARGGPIASKIAKLQAALPLARGDLLAFIDDDVAPRPDALARLAAAVLQPGVGAAFGLACYTNWRTAWSSLMSGFVNANALLSYVPLSYLTEPYTITGHLFMLPRAVFAAAGGLEGMEQRLDDDHELARRVRRLGLRCVQTPVVYDVDNHLATVFDYANQMHRWFTIPRLTMAPHLTPREQAVTLAGSAGALLLPVLGLLALVGERRRWPWRAFAAALATFAASYLACERWYTHGQTPLHRWPWVIAAALLAPLQAVVALFSGNRFVWRGQQIRLRRNGDLA